MMSSYDFYRGSSPVGGSQETGHAYVFRVMPDLYAREWLNVGIGVISTTGERLARAISSPGRLTSLYDRVGAKLIVSMANDVALRFKQGANFDHAQVDIVSVGAVYNVTPEAAIGSLFNDMVTVAAMTQKEFRALQDQALVASTEEDWVGRVHDRLRLVHPFDADRIIPAVQSVRIASDRGEFDVPVHVATAGKFGRIIATTMKPATVQKTLMFALADMERLADDRQAKVALFVGRSESDGRIDEMLDYVYQRKTRAVYFDSESTPEKLADQVDGWLRVA